MFFGGVAGRKVSKEVRRVRGGETANAVRDN